MFDLLKRGSKNNSLESLNHSTHSNGQAPCTILFVGGINVHVFNLGGLETARQQGRRISIFVGSHGRNSNAQQLYPLAEKIVLETKTSMEHRNIHLIVALIDQRNHGERSLDKSRNDSWKKGNKFHAIDMWNIQYGTSCDFSYLMTALPAYLDSGKSDKPFIVDHWGVLGKSLGGHASFLATANDPRVKTCISIIGCPDYHSLMKKRAHNAGILFPPEDYTVFPESLSIELKIHDPIHNVNKFIGKNVLYLSGAEDRLVPSSHAKKFWLNLTELDPNNKVWIEEEGAGHELTPAMENNIVKYINDHII